MVQVYAKNAWKQYARIEIEAQGSLLKVKSGHLHLDRPAVGGTRGAVETFSSKSRKRLLELIARLEFVNGTFITLTYPADYPDTETAKSHLRAFLERVRRRYPKSSAIWRLEYQDRGAPHFHFLFANLPYVPFWELRRWWAEIIGNPPEEALFVRIERIQSKRKAMSYVSKYMAKADEGSTLFNDVPYLHAGRFWGVFNKAFLVFAKLVKVAFDQVTEFGMVRIKQFLSLVWSGVDLTTLYGVSIFTDSAYELADTCIQIALPDVPKA